MRKPALALLLALLAASQMAGQDDSARTKVPKHTLVVHVFDKDTYEPLSNVELVLHSNEGEFLRLFNEDTTAFRAEVPYVPRIDGVVMVPGHLKVVFSVHPTEHAEETTFVIEVFVKKVITIGCPLPEILFPRHSALLTVEAQDSLAIYEELLRENPTIIVELGGHVDAMEDAPLAQERCDATRNHLVGLGIPKDRMLTQAHGKQHPRSTPEQIERLTNMDEREAAHALNRRVEFKVVGFDWVPDKD